MFHVKHNKSFSNLCYRKEKIQHIVSRETKKEKKREDSVIYGNSEGLKLEMKVLLLYNKQMILITEGRKMNGKIIRNL